MLSTYNNRTGDNCTFVFLQKLGAKLLSVVSNSVCQKHWSKAEEVGTEFKVNHESVKEMQGTQYIISHNDTNTQNPCHSWKTDAGSHHYAVLAILLLTQFPRTRPIIDLHLCSHSYSLRTFYINSLLS